MIDNDFVPFCELWTATHDVMPFGKVFAQKHMVLIFEDLENFPLDIIKQAVKRHRQTAKAAPAVNDIIEIINDANGSKHLGVEEAWALAQNLFDENATVVITDEIMAAWGVAECVYPDKIGARMAFKEKYLAIIKTAPEPKWWATQGDSREQRVSAISQAVDLGRLTHERASQLCLGYDKPVATVSGLLESAVKKTNVIDAKEHWANIGNLLNAPPTEKSKTDLLKEHNEAVKEKSRIAIAELKRLHPEEFAKSEVSTNGK